MPDPTVLRTEEGVLTSHLMGWRIQGKRPQRGGRRFVRRAKDSQPLAV